MFILDKLLIKTVNVPLNLLELFELDDKQSGSNIAYNKACRRYSPMNTQMRKRTFAIQGWFIENGCSKECYHFQKKIKLT